jgi:hypothetical protein
MQHPANFAITLFIKRNAGCTNSKMGKDPLNIQTDKEANK